MSNGSKPGHVPPDGRGGLGRRAMLALAGTLLAGCVAADKLPPVLDADAYDMKKPGVTCAPGLHPDEDRGCTRPVGPGEAELRVRLRDDMGVTFHLVHALYVLDGHVVRVWNEEAPPPAPVPSLQIGMSGAPPPDPAPQPESTVATGPIDRIPPESTREIPATAAHMEPRELPVFDIPVAPGPHVLQVRLRYRGNGYGVFAYLRGYQFDVRSSHALVAAPGALTVVKVVSFEKGGVTTPLEERPAVDWIEAKE